MDPLKIYMTEFNFKIPVTPELEFAFGLAIVALSATGLYMIYRGWKNNSRLQEDDLNIANEIYNIDD